MILNAKGRPFSWSYTAVSNYETCPFQYAHRYFYCTLQFQETEATIWGNRVHTAAENFIKAIPVHDKEALAQVERYATAMIRSGWKCIAEQEIALDRNLKSVKWFSKQAWLRVKIDVTLLNFKHTAAKLFDWKTGGTIKDDEDQLRLCAAAASTLHPTVQEYEGKYIWTKHQQVTGMRPVKREEIKHIWEDFFARVARMENAWKEDRFPPRPNGLCRKWCQVTQCVHCGGGR